MELHIRGNPILAAGFLAILKYRNHGVPAKVAIIGNKVLVNDLFNFQAKRLSVLRFGINPFTCLKWESVFGGVFFQNFLKNYLNAKKAAYFKFEVNRRRVEIFIFMMYNM